MLSARRRGTLAAAVLAVLAVASHGAAAHTGSLRLGEPAPPVPLWLVLLTGGVVIGASFLFASLLTDHATIAAAIDWGVDLGRVDRVRERLRPLGHAVGVGTLALVIAAAFLGPHEAGSNLAVVWVWAGWWAGFTMSVYLVGNTWPAIDPWRRLAALVPERGWTDAPERFGAWPSAVALLGLVWLEVVTPVAEDPVSLGLVVVGYTALVLAGAWYLGTETWFGRIDPVARVFDAYGRLAPVQRTGSGLRLALPGSGLVSGGPDRPARVFVIALLWATTFDGFVSTPAFGGIAGALVGVGVPALAVYALAMVAGYGLFLGVYRLAASLVRRTGPTYVSTAEIADRFAPALLPIAAGYHLAHFLGYLVGLLPVVAAVTVRPFGPAVSAAVLPVPPWFGVLALVFVLLGHVVAIWIAHATAFDLFTGRLQPLRSQYPFIAVMVAYTVTSMWIVIQPVVAPPYL